MSIHPSAIVDPGATLGADVRIGPFCIVGSAVTLGDGCELQSHVNIQGPAQIGQGNRFFAGCSIGQQTQDLKYAGEPTYLAIGDHNTFREYCTVHRATAAGHTTRIGSYGNFLAYSHVAHDCTVGDRVIFSNNGTLAGHVIVEDHAIIGGLTAVHQYCRIGRHSIIGGCSKIVQDVPPYMVADGNPAEIRGVNLTGLKRAGFEPETTNALKQAWRILWRESSLNLTQAVERARIEFGTVPEVETLLAFIAASERGVIR